MDDAGGTFGMTRTKGGVDGKFHVLPSGEERAGANSSFAGLRVAVIHYWLVNMRGGERVLEEILALFPQADVFTHVADPKNLSPEILNHKISETFIAKLPFARRHYAKYLALMPRALEEIDLSGYDLVISSESGPAKGVIVPPGTVHVCYCHSPMRYLWDQYKSYGNRLGWLQRYFFQYIAHDLRQWDVLSATQVDAFAANSFFVAERIKRYYRRESQVIHPPVNLDAYNPPSSGTRSDFLFVSELVSYKRADIAIEACSELGVPLVVVGAGPERKALQRKAGPSIRFAGRVSDAELATLYGAARALIFPALEDFGIVPLEAMACGTPVIAYGKGGARDSVVDGKTGLLFNEQSMASLVRAIRRFESDETQFDHAAIARHAARFSPEVFRQRFSALVASTLNRARSGVVPGLERAPEALDHVTPRTARMD